MPTQTKIFLEYYYDIQQLSAYLKNPVFFNEVVRVHNEFRAGRMDSKNAIYGLVLALKSHCTQDFFQKIFDVPFEDSYKFLPSQPSTANPRHIHFIKTILPKVPSQVKFAHLEQNGSLQNLSPEQIEQIEQIDKLENSALDNAYFSKSSHEDLKDFGFKYSILYLDKKSYFIYPGRFALLGKGGFGEVKLLQNRRTKEWAAVKVIAPSRQENQSDFDFFSLEHRESIKTEEAILRQLNLSKGLFWKNAILKDRAFLAMELIDGISLDKITLDNKKSILWKYKKLPAIRWVEMFIGIVEALAKIHKQKILHRDIKPANIIWKASQNEAAFIDYGLAVQASHDCTYTDCYRCGTLGYYPYELEQQEEFYTYNEDTDICSLGLTFRNLLPGNTEDPIVKSLQILANSMAAKNISARLSLAKARKFLKTLEDRCLKLSGDFRRIGIVSLDDLLDDQNQVDTEICDALTAFDQVWIIDIKDSIGPTAGVCQERCRLSF